MRLRFLFLGIFVACMLSGCVAQTFLGDEDEDQADLELPEEFPILHDVPERPAPENMNLVAFDLKLADESNLTNLEYNRDLREKLGLEVEQ
ncbi:MAG: hypothetical protein ABFQ95_02615 [Pseudomonadota bacterium]